MVVWWLAMTARADQCADVPQATAAAAVKLLPPKTAWALFCEPCGDRAPVARVVSRSAAIVPTSTPALVQVAIDGKPVDLAYVFVRVKPTDPVWTNVARLVKCPTTGVSKSIPAPAAPPPSASQGQRGR